MEVVMCRLLLKLRRALLQLLCAVLTAYPVASAKKHMTLLLSIFTQHPFHRSLITQKDNAQKSGYSLNYQASTSTNSAKNLNTQQHLVQHKARNLIRPPPLPIKLRPSQPIYYSPTLLAA